MFWLTFLAWGLSHWDWHRAFLSDLGLRCDLAIDQSGPGEFAKGQPICWIGFRLNDTALCCVAWCFLVCHRQVSVLTQFARFVFWVLLLASHDGAVLNIYNIHIVCGWSFPIFLFVIRTWSPNRFLQAFILSSGIGAHGEMRAGLLWCAQSYCWGPFHLGIFGFFRQV